MAASAAMHPVFFPWTENQSSAMLFISLYSLSSPWMIRHSSRFHCRRFHFFFLFFRFLPGFFLCFLHLALDVGLPAARFFFGVSLLFFFLFFGLDFLFFLFRSGL